MFQYSFYVFKILNSWNVNIKITIKQDRMYNCRLAKYKLFLLNLDTN